MTDTALAIAVPLIASFEGFRSHPYKDQVGVWTIGYGSTYLPNGVHVGANTPPCSQTQAMAWLQTFVTRILTQVRALVHVDISANAEAALTSFAYNEGIGALSTSNVLRHVNDGDTAGAAGCFLDWDMAGGRVNAGILARREREKALFLMVDKIVSSHLAQALA
jgi:lysozyme